MEEITKFESILLKGLTHNGKLFGKLMPVVEKQHFTVSGNGEVFEIVKSHYHKYKQIPTLTELVAHVKNVQNSERRKSILEALRRVSETELVQNVDFMCDETVKWVKDSMYLEALRIGSEGLMQRSDDLKTQAKKIMDDMVKVNVDSDLGLDFDDIDAMIEYYSTRNVGILTQHKALNYRLGSGFIPGTLSVVLAPAGGGKSLFLTDLISGVIKKNENILLVSLEMQDKEIMKRVHANALDLPINSLTDLSKTDKEIAELERKSDAVRTTVTKDKILTAYNKLKMSGTCGRLFIKDYPAGTFSALQLEALVESFRVERGVEFSLVCIDYIGIMKSDLVTPSAGLYSYIKSIGEEVRASAKKMKVPILSCSQLNRGAVGSLDADNSAISDSIGTAMTADFMLFLLQDEAMKDNKEMTCKITKNRFTGKTDTWKIGVDYEKMRFTELDTNFENAGNVSITDSEAFVQTSDDFGIDTSRAFAEKKSQQHKQMLDFAESQVREIHAKDVDLLEKSGSNSEQDIMKLLQL